MKKRQTTSEERALFRATVSEAAIVKPTQEKPVAAPKKATATKTKGGIDGHTGNKLKRGALEPDSKIDLHGMTEAQAHRALSAFLLSAHRRGDRLVLIVTGKGRPAVEEAFDLGYGERPRGILQRMVPRWLEEPALVRIVADRRSAHRRHGGDGALYVYLRKPRAG